MHRRFAFAWLVVAALCACSGDVPTTPPPPAPIVRLRDVVIATLPSPYYHFEYDTAGRVTRASFASEARVYDVAYDGDRIAEMRATDAFGVADRLRYRYDDAGRVAAVWYVDREGVVYTRLTLRYDGRRLTTVERERLVDSVFVIDRTLSLSYYADGNLLELTEHHPAIAGHQDETTTVERFEGYDAGINVDGFSRIHTEFFDHLVLLPGVQIQKNNPARLTHTGDGLNVEAEYVYTYDDQHRPLTQVGTATILNGPNAGQRFPTRTEYSYY